MKKFVLKLTIVAAALGFVGATVQSEPTEAAEVINYMYADPGGGR